MRIFNFCFLLLVLLNSCSKEESLEGEEEMIPENGTVVLDENCVDLSDEYDEYVMDVGENTIRFDTSLEMNRVPEVGQVLLNSEVSDRFPKGYLGKVKSVSDEGGSYLVETEDVPLTEAFRKLYVKDTVALVPVTGENASRAMVEISKDDEGYTNMTFPIGKNDFGISGNVTAGFKLGVDLDFDKGVQNPYGYFTLISKLSTDIGFSPKLEGKHEKKFPIGKPIEMMPLSVSKLVISPVVQPYLVVRAEGKIELKAEFSWSNTIYSAISYKDHVWEKGARPLEQEQKKELNVARISMDGSISAGAEVGVEMRFFQSEDNKLAIVPAVTYGFDGKFVLDMTENAYRNLKTAKITEYLTLSLGAEADAGFIEGDDKGLAEADLFKDDLYRKDKGFVPEFDNVKVVVDKKNGTAMVTSDVKNELFFSTLDIAWGLYDHALNRVDTSEEIEYRKPCSMEVTFQALDKQKEYYVCPELRSPYFEGVMQAEPMTGFTTYEVKTGSTEEISPDGANCSGILFPGYEKEVVEYGICYSASNHNPTINDVKVMVDSVEDDYAYFASLTGLESNTTYYYRSFVRYADGTLEYGEVMSFKTEKLDKLIGLWASVEWSDGFELKADGTFVWYDSTFDTGWYEDGTGPWEYRNGILRFYDDEYPDNIDDYKVVSVTETELRIIDRTYSSDGTWVDREVVLRKYSQLPPFPTRP